MQNAYVAKTIAREMKRFGITPARLRRHARSELPASGLTKPWLATLVGSGSGRKSVFAIGSKWCAVLG